MRLSMLIVGALALGAAGCGAPAKEDTAPDPAEERAAVERALTVWFDSAVAAGDTALVRRGLTDDVAILEDSVWYDRDGFVEFVANLETMFGGPFTLRFSLSDWRTTVAGDVAWTSLRNRAVVTPDSGAPMEMDWRETAVLRKRGDAWRIAHYHSASVR